MVGVWRWFRASWGILELRFAGGGAHSDQVMPTPTSSSALKTDWLTFPLCFPRAWYGPVERLARLAGERNATILRQAIRVGLPILAKQHLRMAEFLGVENLQENPGQCTVENSAKGPQVSGHGRKKRNSHGGRDRGDRKKRAGRGYENHGTQETARDGGAQKGSGA